MCMFRRTQLNYKKATSTEWTNNSIGAIVICSFSLSSLLMWFSSLPCYWGKESFFFVLQLKVKLDLINKIITSERLTRERERRRRTAANKNGNWQLVSEKRQRMKNKNDENHFQHFYLLTKSNHFEKRRPFLFCWKIMSVSCSENQKRND